MNKKLQFSWGHIIAFLALIAVSYISFMGFTYLSNGDFTYAIIGMGATDLLYILFFIGAQQMKASGVKMTQKMLFERIFIFGSPIIFVVGMYSMSHFWTVKSQNDEIVNTFTASINNAHQLFIDYEEYAHARIERYEKDLNQIIADRNAENETTKQSSGKKNQLNRDNLYLHGEISKKNIHKGIHQTSNTTSGVERFKKAGFEPNKANIQKDNMVETLRLQLLSNNFYTLKDTANLWIDKASRGASTWNVFLLGNTQEIKEALYNWESQLKIFSDKELSNEALLGEVQKFSSDGAEAAIDGIEKLTMPFTTFKSPTATAIIFGIVIYLMLIFPYYLQDRHSKSPYKNIISKKRGVNHVEIEDQKTNNGKTPHRGTFRI